MLCGEFRNEIIDRSLFRLYVRRPFISLEFGHHFRRDPGLDRKRRMCVPFNLASPLPADNQDRKFIEIRRHRRVPSQIIEEVEHALPENGTAQ